MRKLSVKHHTVEHSSELTERSNAIPVQSPSPPVVDPKKERIPNVRREPIGVDAANAAICFRHSARGRFVASNDIVNAKAVGAARICIQSSIPNTVSPTHTFMNNYRQKHHN